ncbi:MAG: hypothetical protein QGI56_13955 [Dehalococcoidia bacterium]|jgi:type II secretory pathway pseudopilin PulG|nr:hypothetical protein [Dehalococcoidia bacterium]
MKPKLMAILVIGVLAVSMILTLAGAVNQAVNGEALGEGGSAASLAEDGAGEGQDDTSLVSTLKFVCPFH